MVNFEVASSNSFRDIQKNHFVTAAEAAEEEADIDDSIKRKRIRVSLKNDFVLSSIFTVLHAFSTLISFYNPDPFSYFCLSKTTQSTRRYQIE